MYNRSRNKVESRRPLNIDRVVTSNLKKDKFNTGLKIVFKMFNHLASKKSKRFRSAFTTEQINYLENEFKKCPYISSTQRKIVADTLRISERTVKVWFQNRRMKEKKDTESKDELLQVPHEVPDNNEYTNCERMPLISENEYSNDLKLNISHHNANNVANLTSQATSVYLESSKSDDKINIFQATIPKSDPENINKITKCLPKPQSESTCKCTLHLAGTNMNENVYSADNFQNKQKSNNELHSSTLNTQQNPLTNQGMSQAPVPSNKQCVHFNNGQEYVCTYNNNFCTAQIPMGTAVTRLSGPTNSLIPGGNVLWNQTNMLPVSNLTPIGLPQSNATLINQNQPSGCNCNCHDQSHSVQGLEKDPQTHPHLYLLLR